MWGAQSGKDPSGCSRFELALVCPTSARFALCIDQRPQQARRNQDAQGRDRGGKWKARKKDYVAVSQVGVDMSPRLAFTWRGPSCFTALASQENQLDQLDLG